jgi:hypothetical protein
MSNSLTDKAQYANNVFSFLSDDGRLHKAININNKMYIIEEMVIFPDGQPVQHIELDSEKVG